jgi:peroxiredoxin
MADKILEVGEVAPDFTLKDENENEVTLSSFKGKKNVILSFHPLACTNVCTAQMVTLDLAAKNLDEKYDTVGLGISVDARPTKAAWRQAMGLEIIHLLTDFYPQGEVAHKYGVRHRAGFSKRAVFVVDKQGVIRFAREYAGLPPLEDVYPVLEKLK